MEKEKYTLEKNCCPKNLEICSDTEQSAQTTISPSHDKVLGLNLSNTKIYHLVVVFAGLCQYFS